MRWTFIAPALLLGIALSGCNQQLADFEGIALGQPLPEKPRAASQPSPASNVTILYAKGVYWPAPVLVIGKKVVAMTDDHGRAYTKMYEEGAFGHWGLAQTVTERWILEVQVPAESFIEPPGPGADEFFRRLRKMEEAAKVLSEGLPGDRRNLVVNGDQEFQCIVKMPVNPIRAKDPEFRQYKGIGRVVGGASLPSELSDYLDLSGVDVESLHAAGTEFRLDLDRRGLFLIAKCSPPRPGPGAVNFLIDVHKTMASAHAGGPNGGGSPFYGAMFFGMGMFMMGRTQWVEPCDYWPQLRGITRTGFDVTIEKPGCGKVRIRNLGDRKLRMEYEIVRILDPFMLLAFIEVAGDQPEPRVTNFKSGTGEATSKPAATEK